MVPIDCNNTKIIERDREYVVEMTPFEVMDYNCKYYGSTFNGREIGSRSIIGTNYKVPIIVEELNNLIFFPTLSPQVSECVWLAIRGIRSIVRYDSDKTKIIFNNGKELIIPLSFYSIDHQYAKATKLETILLNRRKF